MILRNIEDFPLLKEKLGLHDGDRVLVMSESTLDTLLTFLVLSANHLTAVIADPAITKQELYPLIDHCQVSAIFADVKNADKMLESQTAPVLLTYGLKSCARVLRSTEIPRDTGVPTPDSVAILFSSGTTASRKCVEISYASLLISHSKIKGKSVLQPDKNGHPAFEAFPMSHVSGLYSAMTVLLEGLPVAAVESLNSDTIQEAFHVFKPPMFGMIPHVNDIFIDKLEEEVEKKHLLGVYGFLSKRAAASIRRTKSLNGSRHIMSVFRSLLYGRGFAYLLSGGAPGTPHTATAMQNLGIAYLDVFASTECAANDARSSTPNASESV